MYKLVAKYVYSIIYIYTIHWSYGLTCLTPFGFQKKHQKQHLFKKSSVPLKSSSKWTTRTVSIWRVLEVDERHEELHIFKEPMRWIVFRRPCFYKGRDPSGVLLVLAFEKHGKEFAKTNTQPGLFEHEKSRRLKGWWCRYRISFGCTPPKTNEYPPENWCLEDYTFLVEMVPFQGKNSFVFRWKNRWKKSSASFVAFPGLNWHLSIFFLRIVFVSVVLFLWHLLQKGSLHLFLFLSNAHPSRQMRCPSEPTNTSWWLNEPPIWKNMRASQIGSIPENSKNVWNQDLEYCDMPKNKKRSWQPECRPSLFDSLWTSHHLCRLSYPCPCLCPYHHLSFLTAGNLLQNDEWKIQVTKHCETISKNPNPLILLVNKHPQKKTAN